MKQLPLPLRVAAGLAATTAQRVRDLPRQLIELPVTVAGQVAQASVRVQQHVTDLAIKGDDALSVLRPVEDTPSWATFDEDLSPADTTTENGHAPASTSTDDDVPADDPPPAKTSAESPAASPTQSPAKAPADSPAVPPALATYDELTLPQLRARLRRFTLAEIEELLAYERAHADRPEFTGMLARRAANVRRQESHPDAPDETAR